MDDPLIDPRRLQMFVAVAETLSFTHGAKSLGLAQQPVSAQIARLERDLGAALFERNTRRVRLTESGRRLYTDAREILSALDRARRNVVMASRGEIGSLAIGCGELAVESLLPKILRAFHAQFPEVTVTLYEHHTSDQLDALRRDDIDVGFALLPTPADDISAEILSEDGFVVAVATSDRPQLLGPIPITAFRAAGFIATPRYRSPGLDELKADVFRDAGFEPRIVQLATNASTMLALVAAGIGVLLTPEPISRVAMDGVSFVPIETKRRARLSMITRREAAPSAALTNFCNVARQLAGRIVAA
jgi:DNA-binding transcriptional LysR family regulator